MTIIENEVVETGTGDARTIEIVTESARVRAAVAPVAAETTSTTEKGRLRAGKERASRTITIIPAGNEVAVEAETKAVERRKASVAIEVEADRRTLPFKLRFDLFVPLCFVYDPSVKLLGNAWLSFTYRVAGYLKSLNSITF